MGERVKAKLDCPYCQGTGKCEATFAARLRGLRNDRGLIQADLAKIAGVTRAQLANLETGRGNPSLECLINLAEGFGVTTDYLLGREP